MKYACKCAAALLAAAIILSGCAGLFKKSASFSATVLRVDNLSVLVRPENGSPEYKSSDLISVDVSKAKMTDSSGSALPLSGLTAGMSVDITYGGVILESYPAQINDCTKLVAHTDGAGLANPMIEFEKPDFRFVAGFALEGIPENVNVEGVWLISGTLAQLNFTEPGGAQGMLRCAKSTGEDISGLHGIEFETQVPMHAGDVAVELLYNAEGNALARWQRDGYDFVLWFPEIESGAFMLVAQSFVRQAKAVEGF